YSVPRFLTSAMRVDVDFGKLRAVDGSQAHGFEELCFQLLRPVLSDCERLERPGTPDAGVDLIVWLDDGTAQAWQSKFFAERLGNSEIAHMKKSFQTALTTYPEIARYTFVVPLNPPSGKPPRH